MSGPETDQENQPWLGLNPYKEQDRKRFFGRDEAAQDALRLVRREVLTVLFGRSGCGKSSLLQAGMFPQLRDERFLPVWLRLVHGTNVSYGQQIREEIEKEAARSQMEVEILTEPLAAGEDDIWEYLHRVVLWDPCNQPVTPLLAFDQFEELFTLGQDQPQIATFLDQLADVVENRIPARLRKQVETSGLKLPTTYAERHYKVIITLREDFVSRLDGLSRDMPAIMHNRYALEPMTGSQALEAVVKPGGSLVTEEVARGIVTYVAAANEVAVADGAVELSSLVIEPALLSLVCSELNLLRIKENRETISAEGLRASGDQIVANYYERCLQGLSKTDRIFIEDRLVTASGFRTAVPEEEATNADLTTTEIDQLVNSRLLRREKRLGVDHIELTHDLLSKVAVRSRLTRREREEGDAREHAKIAAAQAREQELREERKEKKARRVRRDRWLAIGAACLFALLAGVATKAKWEATAQKTVALDFAVLAGERGEKAEAATKIAQAATKNADARSLALNAVDAVRRDPELGLLLAIESASLAFDDRNAATHVAPREIELALRTTTRESLIRRRFSGHTSKVYSVAFDKQGGRLVTSAWHPDATARVWNSQTGIEIARLDHSKIPGSDGKNTTVSCARFSPDGRWIVTSTYRDGGFVYLWDAEGLRGPGSESPNVISKPLATFVGHTSWVTCVAFSQDSRLVASGGADKVVRVWDPETRKEVMPPLAGHTERIRSVVFSRDGRKILTASDDGTAALYDIGPALDTAGAPVLRQVFDAFDGRRKRETLHAAALSPDGNWIATGGNDHYLRIWNASTGAQLAAVVHPDGVMDVDFIDGSRLVSASNDATIRFWELTPTIGDAIASSPITADQPRFLRLVASQRGHQGWIRDIAVSPDRRSIATAGDDGDVRLWTLPQGGEINVLGGYGSGFYQCAALGGSGLQTTVFAGTRAGTIEAVDAWTGEPMADWHPSDLPGPNHEKDIRAISVSPDGKRLVSAGADQTAIVRDCTNGRSLFQWTGHQDDDGGTLYHDHFSSDGKRLVTASNDGGTIYHARFSSDGKRVVTASNDGTAQVWSPGDDSAPLILIPGKADYTFDEIVDLADPASVAILTNFVARVSAHADPTSEAVWNQMSDEEKTSVATLGGDLKPQRDAIRNALNRLVAGPPLKDEPAFSTVIQREKTRWLVERAPDTAFPNRFLLDDAFLGFVKRCRRVCYDARFSLDDSRIVTADFEAQTATIWDAHNGKRLRVLTDATDPKEGHSDNVMSAAFSPDGSQVATACMDGSCRLWNANSGALEASLPHNVAVRDACYSPDGNIILTAAVDGIARLWDAKTHELRSELRGHTDSIPDASFSADGTYIATTSRDGTVRICYTKPWDLYSLATHRVTRKLTESERDSYHVNRAPDSAQKANDKPHRE